MLVVELDVADHFVPEFFVCIEFHLEQPLDLEGVEERFDVCVVIDVRGAGHALHEAMLTQLGLEFKRGELDTPIRVEVNAARGTPVAQCVLQCCDGEFGCVVIGNAPADDAAGEAVDDDCQVTPCASDLEIRDITVPDLIGAADLHVQNAVGHLMEELQVRGLAHEQMIGAALQASLPHETSHAMAADPHAPLAQLLHDAWGAIDLASSVMSLLHQISQLLIAQAALTDRARLPGIKAGSRHLHDLADQRERERLTVCFDEGEDVAFACEANRMAFFRISCSI